MYQGDLAGYFAHTHQLLRFVDKHAEPSVGERFAAFLRAELSPFEQLLMFYHAHQPKLEEMKALIEKYGMLVGLPEGLLINVGHKAYYSARAFTA